jgi:D-tyrosyl-tRNA(Tyr) deacylase
MPSQFRAEANIIVVSRLPVGGKCWFKAEKLIFHKNRFMRVVVQRVSEARVEVDGEITGRIGEGMLVYLSIGKADGPDDAKFMAEKLAGLRIFEDDNGRMNLSLPDVACATGSGQILLISNFTLHGDCRKGRRPGFDAAAEPQKAESLYEKTIELLEQTGLKVARGRFGCRMQVISTNNGPVTFLLDSTRLF